MKELTLKTEGMMCHHCEAHVKKALEALPGVTEAVPDFNTGLVLVRTEGPVEEAALKKAVEDEGYRFLSMQ